MGTAAAECCEERPGDGASPGACATDQITPERPEERLPAHRRGGPVDPAKVKFEWAERAVRDSRRPRRVVPRGGADACLVPLAELMRTLEG